MPLTFPLNEQEYTKMVVASTVHHRPLKKRMKIIGLCRVL